MYDPELSPAEKRRNLLKHGKKGLLHLVFSRTGLVTILLLLQVVIMAALLRRFQAYALHYYSATTVLSVALVIWLLNTDTDPNAKITWLVLVLIAPVPGLLLYVYVRNDVGHRALRNRMRQINKVSLRAIPPTAAEETLPKAHPEDAGLAHYLRAAGGFPAYNGTAVTCFSLGEELLPALLRDLESAQRYIFLEYFIIENGVMWDAVEDVLARKAKSGVEVRVLYDGTCEFTRLPHSFPAYLKTMGIQCRIFAQVRPFVSTHYNYRDHRKIAVIDGRVAYTGGINLADEYINQTHPFGHWKDTGIRLEGPAVRSLLMLFLQMWQVEARQFSLLPHLAEPIPPASGAAGWVIPYGDCPLDDQPVGEWVYTHILNQARRYVHIMTPYLILGHELESALKFAARRGVEVSILLPGIPDKTIPYALAKCHYRSLAEAGVRLYEYTPGFVHAKCFVSDDCRAVVGTVNLDYRSLSHHFECGAYLLDVPCIEELEADFQRTLARSTRVSAQKAAHPGLKWKLIGMVMKAFAPLL